MLKFDTYFYLFYFFRELNGYINEYYPIKHAISLNPKYCEVIKIYQEEYYMFNSFVTRKGSQLTEIISEGLRNVKASESLDAIKDKWFKSCREPSLTADAFVFEYAGGMVLLVSIFTLIAIVVLLIESIYCYLRVMDIFVINPE